MTKLIVAKAQNNEIGKDNDLIWKLSRDMKFFTDTTKGTVVIMGRKNWDSIPLKYRPLSHRVNVVVSRDSSFQHSDCESFTRIEDAIAHFKNQSDKDIFIIGGGQIYRYCLENDLIDEMYITEVKATLDADTFFPEFNEANWSKSLLFSHSADEKNEYDFDVYHYCKK